MSKEKETPHYEESAEDAAASRRDVSVHTRRIGILTGAPPVVQRLQGSSSRTSVPKKKATVRYMEVSEEDAAEDAAASHRDVSAHAPDGNTDHVTLYRGYKAPCPADPHSRVVPLMIVRLA